MTPGPGTDGLAAYVEDATIDVGYRYRSQSVVTGDHDDGLRHENPHEPTATSGTRGQQAVQRSWRPDGFLGWRSSDGESYASAAAAP